VTVLDETVGDNETNVKVDDFFIIGLEGKINMAFEPKGAKAADPTTLAAIETPVLN
jgi:hypothetical protein